MECHQKVPEIKTKSYKVLNWIVICVSVVSSIWPFFQPQDYKHWNPRGLYITLYLVNVLCMFVSSVFMLIALWKMRHFLVERGLGQKMNPIRMVIHALAFLIYIFTFFVLTVIFRIEDPSGESLFYFHWLICIVLGLFAYICLACVLWHLGT